MLVKRGVLALPNGGSASGFFACFTHTLCMSGETGLRHCSGMARKVITLDAFTAVLFLSTCIALIDDNSLTAEHTSHTSPNHWAVVFKSSVGNSATVTYEI